MLDNSSSSEALINSGDSNRRKRRPAGTPGNNFESNFSFYQKIILSCYRRWILWYKEGVSRIDLGYQFKF